MVSDQLSRYPTLAARTSVARSFQVPARFSLDALTVYVAAMLAGAATVLERLSEYWLPSGATRTSATSAGYGCLTLTVTVVAADALPLQPTVSELVTVARSG